ncbi:MAG: hypothetical protein ACK4ON_06890 [Bacteroidia bacterium]
MADVLTSDRDALLLKLRPEIKANTETFSELEAFQNKTIRPIIKFQSDFLLAHVKQYIKKNNPKFNLINVEAQKQYLAQILKSDIRLKNELIAFVVGLFTKQEQTFYYENQNEINKRITQIIYSRCIDLIEELF